MLVKLVNDKLWDPRACAYVTLKASKPTRLLLIEPLDKRTLAEVVIIPKGFIRKYLLTGEGEPFSLVEWARPHFKGHTFLKLELKKER